MRHPILSLALAAWAATGALAQEGRLLDVPEQDAMTDTVQYALEYNPSQQASEWVNPDSGRSGAVVPVRTFEGAQGQPCREFITTIIIGGREEQGYGTACRQPDGDWQIVSDDRQATPQAPPPAPPR
ncbi:MAG: RT0821/Lpp0805 family surface protein, partial [Deferrisomatales bacterium]